MRYMTIFIIIGAIITALVILPRGTSCRAQEQTEMAGMINLPEPSLKGEISIEETLASRRSIRSYSDRALTMDEISQILWSAQGITADWGARTAPSAGGLFPMRIYLVAGKAENLNPGVYLYDPHNNALKPVRDGDYRGQLMSASLNQGCVGSAPISIIITAIPSITEARYGNRSMRYIDNEAGSISQNVYLQCEALGLGTVVIGAFNDDQVAEICSPDVSPRLIMPIGAR